MTPSPRPALRRAPRRLEERRRGEILEAAIALIAEQGLWSVRVADVAERAGISPANVVYYFGTKDALLSEAIAGADERFYAELTERLAALACARERLACLLAGASTADWVLWTELWAYARHHPDATLARRRFHDRWRRALRELVAEGVRGGEWSVADPEGVVERLAALTNGLAVGLVLGDHGPARFVEQATAAAALELGLAVDELREAVSRA